MARLTDGFWREETFDPSSYVSLFSTSLHATVFHDPTWLRVVSETHRNRLKVALLVEGEETIAAFPHFHMRTGPVPVLMSPPAASGIQYLGPLFPGIEDLKQDKRESRLSRFAKTLVDHLRQSGVYYTQIRLAPGLTDARPFIWSGFDVVPRYTYEIDLEKGIFTAWENLKKSVRSDIRRSEREITVEWNRPGDLEAVEELFRHRFAEQGLPAPLPDGFLERLRKSLVKGSLQVLTSRSGGELNGGMVVLRFRNRMALWQGSTKRSHGTSVNDALIWEAAKHAAAEGCRYFELMGANTQRLAAFKAKFNPRLVEYLEVTRGSFMIRTMKGLMASMRRH